MFLCLILLTLCLKFVFFTDSFILYNKLLFNSAPTRFGPSFKHTNLTLQLYNTPVKKSLNNLHNTTLHNSTATVNTVENPVITSTPLINKVDTNNNSLLDDSLELNKTEGLYTDSEQYKLLSKYFSVEESVTEKEYLPLKDRFITKVEGPEVYFPVEYTLECISVVPELFQSNFLLRGEDHWSELIQIRSLFRRKTEILNQISKLTAEKSDSSKTFFIKNCVNSLLRSVIIGARNKIRELKSELNTVEQELTALRLKLPNLLHPEVTDNNTVLKPAKYSNNAVLKSKLDHVDVINRLCPRYIERAVSISGKGFSSYCTPLATLSRALVNYFLDTLTRLFDYTEVVVPLIVTKSTLELTGHLPYFEDNLYKLDDSNVFNGETGYLIPTSEVSLLGLFKGGKFKANSLPKFFTAYSECFRKEIQDYGANARGLIRQHQFGKVELLCFCPPDSSEYAHSLMLSHIEFLLNQLELPYQQVLLSAKETGHTCSKTIDCEVPLPSKNFFLELSSCSNTKDFQTNPLNITTDTLNRVHSVNGSGLAIGRTITALLEYNTIKRENGLIQVKIPKPLQQYLNNSTLILENPVETI
ncbi:Serine--tRNA ligase [Theileria parva strain Muguga]|uniref:Serine--tRNA ligase n=1 Tax=Theileria parva TaxID=5875 RepID=Q4N9F3_THEPA|nr:Serine--tRNA ligase [Theileria parva strain Muguga]EAN33405.1 Serine--tRNA ligase [Theileria parva strain Muguga]|eukprot:XP_765688.1 seryl-tRNA synthetase [Theileria parva strain Muguga]